MGEWSPECRKVIVWRRGGRVRRGTWLTGINKAGWVVWPTNCQGVVFEDDEAIGWRVVESGARWTYRLEARRRRHQADREPRAPRRQDLDRQDLRPHGARRRREPRPAPAAWDGEDAAPDQGRGRVVIALSYVCCTGCDRAIHVLLFVAFRESSLVRTGPIASAQRCCMPARARVFTEDGWGLLVQQRGNMANILVIDDEPDLVRFVRRALEAEGHHVLTATDGAEGLRVALTEPPDLVILDLLMPGVGGRAVLAGILTSQTVGSGRDPVGDGRRRCAHRLPRARRHRLPGQAFRSPRTDRRVRSRLREARSRTDDDCLTGRLDGTRPADPAARGRAGDRRCRSASSFCCGT